MPQRYPIRDHLHQSCPACFNSTETNHPLSKPAARHSTLRGDTHSSNTRYPASFFTLEFVLLLFIFDFDFTYPPSTYCIQRLPLSLNWFFFGHKEGRYLHNLIDSPCVRAFFFFSSFSSSGATKSNGWILTFMIIHTPIIISGYLDSVSFFLLFLVPRYIP